MRSKIIKLQTNEIWPIINALNEVCYGIKVHDFETLIGEKRDFVVELMDKFIRAEGIKDIDFTFSDSELKVIENSFILVFKCIDDWEFQTRLGITVDEANNIKNKILIK